MNSNKIGKILKKINLSLIVIFLLIGIGFLVIGLPLTWHDQYVTKEDTNCFENLLSHRPDKWKFSMTSTGSWQENDAIRESIQKQFGGIANNCNVEIGSSLPVGIYSKRTVIDNHPDPFLIFYVSLFLFSISVCLKLAEKWLTWIFRD